MAVKKTVTREEDLIKLAQACGVVSAQVEISIDNGIKELRTGILNEEIISGSQVAETVETAENLIKALEDIKRRLMVATTGCAKVANVQVEALTANAKKQANAGEAVRQAASKLKNRG